MRRLPVLPALAGLLLFLVSLPLYSAVELRQSSGEALVLEQPAQRIITLAPHLAELVYSAGAGESLLATVEYSDFPAEVAQLPRIGDAFRIDLERVLALKPDLVIAWESGNPPAAVAQLRDLGITTWTVEIREPAEIASTLRAIGRATRKAQTADQLADDFDQRLAALESRFQGSPPVSYFYQIDSDPLFTLNGKHLVSKGLALCGGENIFADVPGLAVQVSHEAVIARDPAAILSPVSDVNRDPLEHWRRWPQMQAVEANALYGLPADEISRATLRWLDSLELACTLLHP